MNQEKLKLIEDIAEEFRKRYHFIMPISMQAVVEVLGGRLEEPIDDLRRNIDNTVPDFVIKNGKYDLSKEQMQFIIAKVIGHLLLHSKFFQNIKSQRKNISITVDNSSFSIEQELEASEFARAFLMPESQYADKLLQILMEDERQDNKQGKTFENVAKFFHVPVLEVINRGESLGVIENVRNIW